MEPDTKTVEAMSAPSAEAAEVQEEVGFLDVLILLAKQKRRIARVTGGATLLAIIISLLLPKIYTANTVILPPQQTQSSATMMLAQLNPLVAGLTSDLGLKNPGDLYVAFLKSRPVADDLIERFKLQQIYKTKTMLDTREALGANSRFSVTKEGLVDISVDDRDPQRAADMANGYVDALQKLTQTIAVTEAAQRRLFYERQMEAAKNKLADAEVALKETQEKTGLIQLDEQARAIIQSTATLRAQIAAKEIQLQRMRLFATGQNPDLQGAEQELSALRTQLAIAERKGAEGKGDLQIATAKVPAAGLEYIRRLREVKYSEGILELLTKQFEAAKLDEANNSVVVQVVAKAVTPERKSKPKRSLIVISTAFYSFLFVVCWVLGQEYYERLRKDPKSAAQLYLVRTYLRGEDKVQS
jgi:uncharacterized protein involved in exopolysaccharide biosynthesis